MKKAFDDWFWQQEGYHLLGERFYDEHKTHDEQRMFEWLKAAYEAGRDQTVEHCIERCKSIAAEADAVAKGIYVTETGKLVHQGMWAGAENCAGSIAHDYGIGTHLETDEQ